MEYRTLGTTGVKVSRLALGTMMLGAIGNSDHDEAARIIHRALDAGVNLVDTADMYSGGESEEIVGKALRGRRDNVVLATKANHPMGSDVNQRGNSRRWLMTAVEDSLRRLGTDWIDLYQVHRPDPDTRIDETFAALDDLIRSGKVRYIGTSTFPAHQLVEAQWAAEHRRTNRFVTEQPPYSLFSRTVEAEVLPTALRYRLGVITWSPLAGGWLTGRWRVGHEPPRSHRADLRPGRFDLSTPENQAKLAAADALGRLAEEHGMTLVHLALAFATAHPAVTSCLVGPRTIEQLETQLGAAELQLSDEVLDRVDEIVAPGTALINDALWTPPELADPNARRRRPPRGRCPSPT